MSYILWALRHPCGTYKVGWGLCAPSDSELRTWNSELVSVVWSMVDRLGKTCGLLSASIPTQMGFSHYTNPKEVADFRSALKAGVFPPLIPGHFLKSAQDLRNNASPSSYVSKAAKGVKPGAKILPRHLTSPLPSWHETWTKAEDWLPVPKGQEDILWWGLGAGFRCQYRHPLEVIVDVDEMASSHGAFGSMQME